MRYLWTILLFILFLTPSIGFTADVETINLKANSAFRFSPDAQVWQQPDYWATPQEAINKGLGDCEDYAVFKALLLRQAGVAPELIRLAYVQAPGEKHLVTLLRQTLDDKDPLVLDNLIGSVRPLSRRPDLAVIFEFNSTTVWDSTGFQTSAGSSLLLKLTDVLRRVKNEGEFTLFF